jgi:hypothetical protein
LRTLIEQARARKGSLYICFIDFSEAFDTIPRQLLWERLRELRIHGIFLRAVQSMYHNVKARVSTPEGLTEAFPSEMGIKQGCPMSPLLFGLFLDPLEELLLQGDADAPLIGDRAVPAQFLLTTPNSSRLPPRGYKK